MKVEKDTYVTLEGVSLLSLADKYGCPLYVYDAAKIEQQFNKLKKAYRGADTQINFACKALSNVSVLNFLKSIGCGLEAVSIQEIKLGLYAGFLPEEILYTPSGVSMEEIEEAVAVGVRINLDNTSILEQFGHRHPHYPVGIRINPHIMAGGNLKISTGHVDSKFGISHHQLPLVQRIVKAHGMQIHGLHMHTGSEIKDAATFLEGAEILFEVARQFDNLSFIDFGGGFKVPYKPEDKEIDIDELGAKITTRFSVFCKEYGRDLTLKIEPGKYLVSEAGSFLVRVNAVKQTTSTTFAAVDSGLNHLIRPMFYDAYHEIINISRPQAKNRLYTIVGYICETDTFGANRQIAEIQEEDILCFKNAGAYGFSMSSNYNSRYRPAEVMVYQAMDYLIRERETFDDILNKQQLVKFTDQKLDLS